MLLYYLSIYNHQIIAYVNNTKKQTLVLLVVVN